MEKKLIYLLLHIGKLVTDEVRINLDQHGLHFGQARILLTLLHFKKLNQREISEGLHIKPATVTNLIKKLESSGLISRMRSNIDDRIINVTLTKKGIEAAKITQKEIDKIDMRIIEALGANELDTITKPLLKIRDTLGGIEPELLKE